MFTKQLLTQFITSLVLAALLVVGPEARAQSAAAAGELIFVHGEVTVLRDDETRDGERGMDLYAGDEVTTAAASSAQIRFTDDSMVAIRPDSHYSLTSYSYDSDEPASGEQRSELLRGGLRAISGAIGQARPEQVEFETPVATMGIRGTDLQILHIEPGAEGQYDGAPTGSYLNVQEGLVSMSNQGGAQLVSAGETFYVPDANTPPQPTPVEPEQLFSEALPGPEEDEDTDETVATTDDDLAEPDDTGPTEEPVTAAETTSTGPATDSEAADYSTEERTQQTALAIQDEEEQLPAPTPGEEPVWPGDPDAGLPDDDDEVVEPDPEPAPELAAVGVNLTERGFLAQDDNVSIELHEDGSLQRIVLDQVTFQPHSDAEPQNLGQAASVFPGVDNMIYWGSYLPETYDLFADAAEFAEADYGNMFDFGYMYADHWFGTVDQALMAMGEGGQFTFMGSQPTQLLLGDDFDLNIFQAMVSVDLAATNGEQVSIEMPYFSEYFMAEGLLYGAGAMADLYGEGIELFDLAEILDEGWFWGTFTGEEGIDGLMSSFWLNFIHPESEESYSAWGNWFLARNCLQDLVNGQACNPLDVPLEPFTDGDHLFAGEEVLLAARTASGLEVGDNSAALGYAPDGDVPLLLAFLEQFGSAALQVHDLAGVTGGADNLLSVDTSDGTMHITWGRWQADSYSMLTGPDVGAEGVDAPGTGQTQPVDTNLHYIMVTDAAFDFSAATGTYTFTYENGSGLVSEADQSVIDLLEGQITVEAADGTMAVMLAFDVSDETSELAGTGDYADFLFGEQGLTLTGAGYFTEGLLHGLAAGDDAQALIALLMAMGGESDTTYQGALAFLQSDWEEELEPAPAIAERGPNLTEHGFLAQDDTVALSFNDDGSIAAVQVDGIIFEPHSEAEPQNTGNAGSPFPGADNMIYWGSYLPETYDLFSDPDTHEPATFSNELAFGYMYADHWYGTADEALSAMGEGGRFTFSGGGNTRVLLGDDFDLNLFQAMVTVDLGQYPEEQVSIEMPYFSESLLAEGLIYGDGAVADLYGDGIELFDLAEIMTEGWFWGTFTGEEGIDGLMSSFWLNFLNPETEENYTTWGNWFLARNCLQDLLQGQACNPLDVPLTELAQGDHLFASETALVAGRNSAGSQLGGGATAWGHAPDGEVPMLLAMLQQFGNAAFQVHDLAGVTGGADNLLTVDTEAGPLHVSWGMWEAGSYSAVTQPGFGMDIVEPGPEPGEPVQNFGLDSNLHYIMVSEADFDLSSTQGKFEFTYEDGSGLIGEGTGDLIEVLEGKITVYADQEAIAVMLAFDTPDEVSELFGEGSFNNFLFGEQGLALTGDGYFAEGLLHGTVTGPQGDVLVALLQAIAAESEAVYQGALAFLQSSSAESVTQRFGEEYAGLWASGTDLQPVLAEESMAYLDSQRTEAGTQLYLAEFFDGETRYIGSGSAAETPAYSWSGGEQGTGSLILWGHYAPGEYMALEGSNPYTATELANDTYVHYALAEAYTPMPEYDLTGEMNFSLLSGEYEFGIYHTTQGMTHRLLDTSQVTVDFGDFSDSGTFAIDLTLEDVGGGGSYHHLLGSGSVADLYGADRLELTVESAFFDAAGFSGLFVGEYYEAILAMLDLLADGEAYLGQAVFGRDPGTWFDLPEVFEAPDYWYDGMVMTHSEQNRQNLVISERDITLYFADYSDHDLGWRLWGYDGDNLDRTREHPGPNPSDFASEVVYLESESMERDVEVNWGYWEQGSYRNETTLGNRNQSRMHWIIASDITPFDTERTLPEGSREFGFVAGSELLADDSDWVFTMNAADSAIMVDFDNATMDIDLFLDSADTTSNSHLFAEAIDLYEFWDPSSSIFLDSGNTGLQNGYFEGTFVGPDFEGIMSMLRATYPGEGSFRGTQVWEQIR